LYLAKRASRTPSVSTKARYKYIKLVTYGTARRRIRLAEHMSVNHTDDIYTYEWQR